MDLQATGAETSPAGPELSKSERVLLPDDVIRAIFAYWWAQRAFVLKVLGIVGILTIAILLVIPNRYRAEAKVIILPPKFSSEIRTEPLSVITAKNLLQSGELVDQLITTIRRARPYAEKFLKQYETPDRAATTLKALGATGIARKLGSADGDLADFFARLSAAELSALASLDESEIEDWTIEKLSKALDCEEIIEKKTAADVKLSPLLNLYAVANSGAKAQLLVNTWAMLFEKKYDEITNQKTRYQYDYILKQQQEAEQALAKQQQAIVEFKAANNLDLMLREIEEYSADYKEFLNRLVQKRHELENSRRRLQELQTQVAELTDNGVWVGEIEASALMNASADTTLPLTIAEVGPSPYGESRRRVLELRNRILFYLGQLNKFRSQEPVELVEKELAQLQRDYLEAVGKLRAGEVRLNVLERSLAALEERLTSTPRYLILFKDVPDQSVAEAIRTGQRQQLSTLAGVQFRREEINPEWTLLTEQKLKLEAEYLQTSNEVTQLREKVARYEREARDLQVRLYQARVTEKALQDSLEMRIKSSRELLQNYLDARNAIHNTALQIGTLEAEIRQLEEDTTKTRRMAEEVQKRYNEASARLQLLEIQLRAVQRNADLLTQKLQDARMAIAQQMSDVSLAAPAATPTKHYFPPRTILLLGIMFLTLVSTLGILGRIRYVELKRA
ncbi:MAG: hypothetical protein N2644_07550 [Candidatus Sumerlaea chitinivorans]|nr:hypothetical protein [Candidatus Sumerlaea chitinivorans]